MQRKPKKSVVSQPTENPPRAQYTFQDIVNEVFTLINDRLTLDLKDLRQRITDDVLRAAKEMIAKEIEYQNRQSNSIPPSPDAAMVREICREEVKTGLGDMGRQIVASNNKQLAITKKMTGELSRQVHESVIEEINATLVPELNRLSQWVTYNTEDTTEMITNYRRAVQRQEQQNDKMMIGSGNPEKDRLANFQRTTLFFTDDE